MNGEEGVGSVSSLIFHSGGAGGVDVAAGRVSEGPRLRAPPVKGEGLKVSAGCCWVPEFGGSNDGGYSVESGTAGMGVNSTVRLAALSNRSRSYIILVLSHDALVLSIPSLLHPFLSS